MEEKGDLVLIVNSDGGFQSCGEGFGGVEERGR